ncbi:MAG: hypothetical protein JO189_04625 [Deltaproteobacteria bacterium]|nr:hypothetical protein [Deltaproteobacteria bacterium]
MKDLPVPGSRRRELPDVRDFAARIFGKHDAPEPVSAWRIAPEAALADLAAEEKKAYIAALVPLVRGARKLKQRNLRRLYQLFAFMEMPAAERLELVTALEGGPPSAPELAPVFRDHQVRRSLVEEAEVFARDASSKEAFDYVSLLRVRLNVKPSNSRKLTRLLEKLTDIENRAAALLGKRGHIVRLNDRRLEIFKKGVAAVGVPSAVLFPLGTVGLSAEGITTGLIALGGGFILPAGIAAVTGLGVVVALGITTKKMLDMLMPTVDADRASIDVQQLRSGVIEVRHLLDEIADEAADPAALEYARERITAIMQRIAPLTNAQRSRIETALSHARLLGERYLASLEHDRAALEQRHHVLANELGRLLDIDRPAITAT